MSTDDAKSRGHGDKKPRLRDRFIAALLTSSSVEAAAKSVGIGRATATRWLQDPEIVQRLTEARRQSMLHAMLRLQTSASGAVTSLVEAQSGESESARVTAARCILEMALRSAELGDLEERLSRLEEVAKSRGWRGFEEQPHATPAKDVNGHA